MIHSHSKSDLLPIDLSENRKAPEDNQSVIPILDADQLQELLHRCSPVTHIPPEILAYIFGLYLTRSGADDVRVQGPTCLAQVCRLWRAVVGSDPQLWTHIHFYFPESHDEREDDELRAKPMLDLHLKRSGTLPLSLTFTDHRMYHPKTKPLVSLLVDRLRAHARRWKSISLHLAVDYIHLLFSFTPCDLSSLEHFHISGDVVRRTRTVSYFSNASLNLESATNLKSFTYGGQRRQLRAIYLHWENLSWLSFGSAPHFGTLSKCQNITTCSLAIESMEHGVTQAVTLPHLQTLRVRRLSPYAHARCVIDLLTLPLLQNLEIDASFLVGWNERWHDGNFSDLLVRSGCTLRHLSIQDVDFPNDELVRCLVRSSALTSLRFVPCPRSQDIRDVICELDVSRVQEIQTQEDGREHDARSAPLVPFLRQITLATSVREYLDPMAAMFRSRVGARARAAGVTALRCAEVLFFDMWHHTDVDQVHGLGDRLERVERFQVDMAQWVSENNEDAKRGEDKVEVSVVVDSPYLPEYVDVR